MATVNLSNLNKIYSSNKGSVHAVKDLNIQINDGEFVALLGPSGCGKTSTLRMIVGLEEITSGTVAFNDKIVNALAPEKRNVAMAFETYALYPNFTASENFGLNKNNNLSNFDIIELAGFSPISGVRRSFDTAWTRSGQR